MEAINKLGVIADDLTGANDTGVQFSKCGLRTMVLLDSADIASAVPEAGVIVVSTDSRASDRSRAYECVRSAARAFRDSGITRVYKKIDSTLRGNVGAELDAVMDAFDSGLALVVPAFPAMGRVTLQGSQFLGGVPLHQTEVIGDPVSPVYESHIPTLIGQQSRRDVGHLPLDTVALGPAELKKAILDASISGVQILVLDCTEQAHLRTIATTIALLPDPPIVAGSAGLASEIPAILGVQLQKDVEPPEEPTRGVLVVGGSKSSATLAQIEYVRASMGVPLVYVDPGAVLSGLDQDPGSTFRLVEEARRGLSIANSLIISLNTAGSPAGRTEAAGLPTDGSATRTGSVGAHNTVADSRRIAGYLGSLAKRVADSVQLSGMVLTGGDTALAICKSLGAFGIIVTDEIVPGIPLGRLVGGPYAGMPVVTKAGSFGEQDAISRAIRFLEHAT